MRLVIDTNVLVSAFLWEGTPGRLIDLASDGVIEIAISQTLLDELGEVLHRRKLASQVLATGSTPAQILRNFRNPARGERRRKALLDGGGGGGVIQCRGFCQKHRAIGNHVHLIATCLRFFG